MTEVEIQTENLRLVLQTPEETLAAIEALSPDDRAHVSADWLARVRALTGADPWTLGFAVVHHASAAVIGSCGFKGPPDADGVVEIAYGTDADHQGKGYATEAARALVTYAFGDPLVRVVRAHTLEKANASARVLTKCGFRYIGEVIEPEDGLVRRWEKHREAAEPAAAAEGGARQFFRASQSGSPSFGRIRST
jgi:RimJ/RimL family protein N-acetyltransferase